MENTKYCWNCNTIKSHCEFTKNKQLKDELYSKCRECLKQKNGRYYGPEQKETIDINFKSTEGKVTQTDVKPYILDELAQRSHEYMYDELISIDEIKIIPMEETCLISV
jgi:hypothetical protein